MLKRIVVVESLVRQPVVDWRELFASQVVRYEMKVRKPIVMFDDLRQRQPPDRAVDQGPKKDNLVCPECGLAKLRSLMPDDIER